MVEVLIGALAIAGMVPLIIGLVVMVHILRPQERPADKTNRINKIRLVWFALTREYLFTGLFPWLKNDELDNINKP